MAVKLSDLAEKLDIPLQELKEKIIELGFEISDKSRTIDEESAELIEDELSGGSADNPDVAELYDEIISEQRERELVKTQRKKMAGQTDKKSTSTSETKTVLADTIEIGDSISVKEFAEKTGLNIAKVIGELMKNGILANINQEIDFETAQILADDLGIKLTRSRSAAGVEELMSGDISSLLHEDNAEDLIERPPVVCVMGHVDHGKTQLLDTIREANVVAGESGGITQHIGAYQVEKKGKKITFLDTPGHEAFTAMRARGAKVTDIAILVVAADEGMKPQTIEAMNHAKEAGVTIIVAINKIDKPDANIDKVKGELAEHGLQPEDWGGKTITVPVSALKGDGIDDLLEMILLTAEIEQYKGNPDREAVGTVIEAHLDKSLGPVATLLINTGTLHITDNVIVGETYGRIKLMQDHNGKAMKVAGPSTPVLIAGLDVTPKSGDIVHVVKDERTARLRAEEVHLKTKEVERAAGGLSSIITSIKSDKVLKLVIKADAKGSLEAIKQSLAKIKDEEVALKVIHSGVGRISESDIMMAKASGGLIVAFHSEFFSPSVKRTADREGVEVRSYKIIYDLIEDIKKFLNGLIDAELVETKVGRGVVKQIFFTKKKDMIVGCKVNSGKFVNKAKIKIIRGKDEEDEDLVVAEGRIQSLRRGDNLVDEIGEGNDCGIKYSGEVQLEEGDIIDVYTEEQVQRSIS
jgi:translation initiation factor IF-2